MGAEENAITKLREKLADEETMGLIEEVFSSMACLFRVRKQLNSSCKQISKS